MRCPDCGGRADHIITDIAGDNYYRCMTGLTRLGRVAQREEGKEVEVSNIVPCDTIIGDKGKKVTGIISYYTGISDSGSKAEIDTLKVVDGKDKDRR